MRGTEWEGVRGVRWAGGGRGGEWWELSKIVCLKREPTSLHVSSIETGREGGREREEGGGEGGREGAGGRGEVGGEGGRARGEGSLGMIC